MKVTISAIIAFATASAVNAQQPPENPIPSSGGALVMQKKDADSSALPYSPVIEANGVLYLAGHIGRDPETGKLAREIKAETRQTLQNIGRTLASVGATHADVVRCQVFLDDIDDFADMNEVYRTFFPNNPPARTTVEVSKIVLNAKIEIECTAISPGDNG